MLARRIGVALPIYPIKGYSLTIPVGNHAAPPTIGSVDETNLVAISRFGDRVRVTATAEFAGYDTSHKPADFSFMKSVAQELYPDGADYHRAEMWAGLRPMTPDNLPILGRRRHRNLWFNTGHGHIGWTMSHGCARITADLIARAANGDSGWCLTGGYAMDGSATNFTDLGVLPCTLDDGIATRAAIGLLVLATDQTMEHEFRHLIRLPGVAVYGARLFNDAEITPETLRAMRDRIAPAAELILPGHAPRRGGVRLHLRQHGAGRG